MKKLLYLFLLPSVLFSQTTPSVTPRADGEGSLGTETYRWGEIHTVTPSVMDNSSKVPTTSWIRNYLINNTPAVLQPEVVNLDDTVIENIEVNKIYAIISNYSLYKTFYLPKITEDNLYSEISFHILTQSNNKYITLEPQFGDTFLSFGAPDISFNFYNLYGTGDRVTIRAIPSASAPEIYNWFLVDSTDNLISKGTLYIPESVRRKESLVFTKGDYAEGKINFWWDDMDFTVSQGEVLATKYDFLAFRDLETSSPYTEFVQPVKAPTPTAADDSTNVATTAWVQDLVLPIVSDVDTKLSGYLKKNSYPTGYQTHEGELILDSDLGEKILTLDMPDYGNLNAMWARDYDGIIDIMAQDYDPYTSKLLMSFKDIFTSSPYTEFVQPVKAPTPTAADDSTNVATTAWVQDEIATKLGGAVDSVAGKTGVVTLDADDVSETATKLWFTATERAKLTGLGGAVEPSGTDDTTAIQNAIDAGGIVQLGAGIYIVTSVDISNDVIIQGVGSETIIKRKDGTITTQYNEPDARLFNIDTDGIRVVFRDLTIDENEANQNAYAAYGYAIGVDSTMDTITQGIDLVVENCTIKNITNCGIAFRTGDTETVRSYLSVINCTFLDGRVGLAAYNENVVSPSGFSGYYISCSSFTQSHIVGNRFRFTTTLNDAEFPPVAIMATSGSNGSSGSEMLIEGNYFYGCGRGNWYNSTPTIQLAGNDLGVIDIYNFGKRVRIVNNQFENNYAPAIRGKTNVDQLFVSGNIINDTFPNYGITFGPSSLTEQVGNITITNNQISNTGGAGIAISGVPTGHSTTKIINVVIDGNRIDNVDTYNSSATGISCGYIDGLRITNNDLKNVELIGVNIINTCNDVEIENNIVECGGVGIYHTAIVTGKATIIGNTVTSGGIANSLRGSDTNSILIDGNVIVSAVNYGFYITTFARITATNNEAKAITGSGRLFRAVSCNLSVIVSGNSAPASGIAQYWYPHTGSAIAHIFGNSWNPCISYGTAAPASGTYKAGDIVYNTTPAPSGYTGWICTTAGTPGTWKGFGMIQS